MTRRHYRPILIAGQGLAGTLLAVALIERGRRVLVADPGHAVGASGVAAGLVNPITGQRLARAGDLETLLPATHRRLTALAELLGQPVHRPTPILRYLWGDRPRTAWPRRREDSAYTPYLEAGPEPDSVWIHGGAVVDNEALIRGVRAWLADNGNLVAERVDPGDVTEAREGIRWAGGSYSRVVFCEGDQVGTNPWFGEIPLAPIKGQVLEGRASDLPAYPVHGTKSLVPLGGDRFRVGATYDRDDIGREPTEAGRVALEAGMEELLPRPEGATINRHLAAIRPGSPDGRPFLGHPPGHPRVGLFNGLGSKGLLLGPYYADRLAQALAEGGDLPPEATPDRFAGSS
ncbi:NAD(P)/FAD-dependent oxidoreductase [Thiohalorhabdus sp.]|uniref:NAD(P)/FAD-dependent oxidoreductase n=1 Tax=Thiohalorhabdus sp. TaxID=3094134 RepID=UPI002FC3CA42